MVSQPYRYSYNQVSAGDTGSYGLVGDYLDKVIVTVSASATSQVELSDGATVSTIIPNNTSIGVYPVSIKALSNNASWSLDCGAGSSALMIGIFSPATSNVWNDADVWNDSNFWSD